MILNKFYKSTINKLLKSLHLNKMQIVEDQKELFFLIYLKNQKNKSNKTKSHIKKILSRAKLLKINQNPQEQL